MAVDAVTDHLKKMSKPVTTPEEIAQVCYNSDTNETLFSS